MSFKVRNYSDIDISNIQFSDPKKTRAGSYLVEMYLKNGSKRENIYIQTPKLTNLSGINLNDNRSYVEFEFDSENPDFYQFFTKLDEKCILTSHQKSKKWFKQAFPLDVIDEFYKSNIKPGRNNHFPTIKFKIPVSKKQIKAEFYNYKRERINHEEINENEELVNVIHIIGMKFLKQQFILETQLLQSKVCKKSQEKSSLGYIINDSESDYENDDYLIPFPDEVDEIQFQDENNELEINEKEILDSEVSQQTEDNEEIEGNAEQLEENEEQLQENEEQLEENEEQLQENEEQLEENQKQLEENEQQLEENEQQLEENEEQLEENEEQLEENEEQLEENEEQLEENEILSEINIDSLNMGQELSIEDKNVIKEELNNISSRKNKLLNRRRKKINDIQKQLEIKNKELETLQRDQEIFEDPNYEYHTDDELLDDEILNYQQT
jgi:flagellar biosynthesis GTPase FlhF